MKLNKYNFILILGIYPLFILLNIIILKLSFSKPILFTILIVIFIVINLYTLNKLIVLPRKSNLYGILKEEDAEIPEDIGLKVYSSETLSKYHLNTKPVEIYSPLFIKKDNQIKIVISKTLLKQNKLFQEISITRECLKFKSLSTVKTVLLFITPILFGVNLILILIIMYNTNNDPNTNPFLYSLYMPFMYTIVFLLHVYLWNKYTSKAEQRIDKMLTKYFSVDQVVSFIKEEEALIGKGESDKYKKVNTHYMNQRIDKFKN